MSLWRNGRVNLKYLKYLFFWASAKMFEFIKKLFIISYPLSFSFGCIPCRFMKNKCISGSKKGLVEINWLWTSDVILWHRSGSTLAQIMACCWMAPNHYLNQCWLINSEFFYIPFGPITQQIQMISISEVRLKISFFKILPHFSGAYEYIILHSVNWSQWHNELNALAKHIYWMNAFI